MASGLVAAPRPELGRGSCAFPGVCVLPSGRWLCSFRAAPTKAGMPGQHVLLCHSDDEGRSWSEPVAPFAPPRLEGRPGLLRALYCTALGGNQVLALLYWVDHSDPARPFFNEQTEGLLESRLLLARSDDGGETWSASELLDTSPYNVPTPPTGPVLLLPDGALALQFELNKAYDDPAPWRHASVLMFSEDGGRTWPRHVRVTADPENRVFYWDQRPALLAGGRLLDLLWTYDRAAGEYRNIHACESADGGRGWSAPWDTEVPGQAAQPVSVPRGLVLMVYMDRTGRPLLKARASGDGGRSWPAESELVLCEPQLPPQAAATTTMQEAWEEMERFSLGLPATAALPGADVLVVYYRGPEPDRTGIEWLRVAVEHEGERED